MITERKARIGELMKSLTRYYLEAKLTPSDINEHIHTINYLAQECSSAVEIGVRKMVSSWAILNGLMLGGKGKEITLVDIKTPIEYGGPERYADFVSLCAINNIKFEFKKESSLLMEPIETDLLFIDTVHNYEFLGKELPRHGPLCQKYIVLHDTEVCKTVGDNGEGMWKAVEEFLNLNKEFSIKNHFTNNNGLTVLERNHE